MTIGGNPYATVKPAHARRPLVYLGLVLILSSIPLTLASLTVAAIVALVGGVAFAYGLLSSNFPWLGLLGGSLLTSCSVLLGRWLFLD